MKQDVWLYGAIAGPTFANTCTLPPTDWHFWSGLALAAVIAVKAKRSKGTGDSNS